MISLKRLVYYIDGATSEKDKYISIKDMSIFFINEDCDYKTILNRIKNQLHGHRNMFAVNKIKGRVFWRLSANGYRYFNKWKDIYDPILDVVLILPNKIEVIQ